MTMKIEIDLTQHEKALREYDAAKEAETQATTRLANAERDASWARSALEDARKRMAKASADLGARFLKEAKPALDAPQLAEPAPEGR